MHKSCSERRNITVINKNLIWCSKKCAEDAIKLEDNIIDSMKQYEDTIKSLRKEIEEKDRYIQRLKICNRDLEQEMLEFDQISHRKIEEQSLVITELKDEIRKSLAESRIMTKTTSKILVDTGTQTTYLSHRSPNKTQSVVCQTESKLNCSSSTQTETELVQHGSTQTELSEEEIEEVRYLNALLKINVTKSTQTSPQPKKCLETKPPYTKQNDTETKGKRHPSKPQLILLTNLKLGELMNFKEYTNHTFDINMQYIHKGCFDDLVVHTENYVHRLNSQDALVMLLGPENAITGKGINLDRLQKLIMNTKQTNVFISACPLSGNRSVLNNFIQKINSEIKQSVDNTNITFIETTQIIPPQIITSIISWEYQSLNNLIKHISKKLQSTLRENEGLERRLQGLRQDMGCGRAPQENKSKVNIIQNLKIKSPNKNLQNTPVSATVTHQTQISPIVPKNYFFRPTNNEDTGW